MHEGRLARRAIRPEERVFELEADRAGRFAVDLREKELAARHFGGNASGVELAVLPHHDAKRVDPRRRLANHRVDDGDVAASAVGS